MLPTMSFLCEGTASTVTKNVCHKHLDLTGHIEHVNVGYALRFTKIALDALQNKWRLNKSLAHEPCRSECSQCALSSRFAATWTSDRNDDGCLTGAKFGGSLGGARFIENRAENEDVFSLTASREQTDRKVSLWTPEHREIPAGHGMRLVTVSRGVVVNSVVCGCKGSACRSDRMTVSIFSSGSYDGQPRAGDVSPVGRERRRQARRCSSPLADDLTEVLPSLE